MSSEFFESHIRTLEGHILDIQSTILPEVSVPLGARHEAAYWLRGAQEELQDIERSTKQYLAAIRRVQDENNGLIEEVTTLQLYRQEAAKRQAVLEKVALTKNDPAKDSMSLRIASKKHSPPAPHVPSVPSFVLAEQESSAAVIRDLQTLRHDIALEPDHLTAEEHVLRGHYNRIQEQLTQATSNAQRLLEEYTARLVKYRHLTQPQLDTLSDSVTRIALKKDGLAMALARSLQCSEKELAEAVARRRLDVERRLFPLREEVRCLDEELASLRDEATAHQAAYKEKIKNMRRQLKDCRNATRSMIENIEPASLHLTEHVNHLKERLKKAQQRLKPY